VAGSPPQNDGRPTVSGAAVQGSTLTAGNGNWSGAAPLGYAYRWLRCDAAGQSCVAIAGAAGSTYALGGDDVGHRIRVEVTATNPDGARAATSEETAAVTGGGTSPTDPPLPGPDISHDIPDSQVTPSKCQRILAGTGFKQQIVKGLGTIRVQITATDYISPTKPLQFVATLPADKIKSVEWLLDERVVARSPRTGPYKLSLTPKQLASAKRHDVAIRVVPKKIRKHRMDIQITNGACVNVLSGFQWQTATGTGLRLRVDSRTAIASGAFTVPAKMLPSMKDAGSRAVGSVLMYMPRGKKVRYDLKLAKGDATATLLRAAATRPLVKLTKTGFTVGSLPANVGIVEITLYTQDKTKPGALLPKNTTAKLGAKVVEHGKSFKLATTIKAQRH
jgi:hypothetical protein